MTRTRLCVVLAGIALLPGGYSTAQTVDLPVELQSIQHFYAILKRCERVSPDKTAMRAREAAFDRLIDGAKSPDGVWRTLVDADGRPQETQFRTARDMLYSVEFASDVKRYEQMVSIVPLNVQVQDCREFGALVEQALSGKP